MIAQGWRRDLKDVGDQALMRGLVTSFPIVRPGRSLSYGGRQRGAGHKAADGSSIRRFQGVHPDACVTEFLRGKQSHDDRLVWPMAEGLG